MPDYFSSEFILKTKKKALPKHDYMRGKAYYIFYDSYLNTILQSSRLSTIARLSTWMFLSRS